MTINDHAFKGGLNSCGVTANGREYTAELHIFGDDPEDTGHSVVEYLLTQGFVYGAPYVVGNDDTTDDTYLYEIEPPQLLQGSCVTWFTTLRYASINPALNSISGTVTTDPLELRPRISTSTVSRLKPQEKAIYLGGFTTGWTVGVERLVTNSAGVQVIPAHEIDVHNLVVTIVRNFSSVIMNQATFPLKWINSKAFTLDSRQTKIPVPAYGMKFLGYRTEEVYEQETDFVRVTFEGELTDDPDGWRVLLLDHGTMIDTQDTSQYASSHQAPKEQMVDRWNNVVSQPCNLNGAGLPVAVGDDAEFYGKWGFYRELDVKIMPFFLDIVS